MDPEIEAFIRIWLTAATSVVFCHQIAARIHGGAARLLVFLPIMCLFTILPLPLSSVHLGGPTCIYLVWIANIKLLLFSFDQGPLANKPPLSLLQFLCIALIPIKSKHTPAPESSTDRKVSRYFSYLIKSALLAGVVGLYNYRASMHPYLILTLYCCHVYLGLDLVLSITAAPVRELLGLDLEPQFDKPYLATSLQNFWGRRWNLIVTGILRPSVYFPVRRVSVRILGERGSQVAAILATFLVSGLMHEWIYYYLTRARPTWEVTWFFVLHGVCVAVEASMKKAFPGVWRPPAAVSRPLTLGFTAITGGWLFFPQIIRNGVDLKAINEYWILVDFVKERIRLQFYDHLPSKFGSRKCYSARIFTARTAHERAK